MSNRNSTINGLAIAHARKIAKRTFGENLDKVLHNDKSRTFDVYIYDTADPKEIEKFEDWREFRIWIVTARLHAPAAKKEKFSQKSKIPS